MENAIVFHFDNGEAELNIAISNITNTFAAYEGQECSLVLVVNGPGIKLMGKDSPFAGALEALCDKGLSLRVCNNALTKFGLAPEWLTPSGRIVPAGIIELVELQRKGYIYIKP
ncbi:DsrE family protein [Desulfovibrio subterraneus]|jgi:intracellular sulfur oxidation DsrE/DsrF family protein|uniref:Sulfur reduction protein DsrE n=1 Tax=Desulfovibrio subterraneus TaxID=2718620 RepID=A0A7J0BLJ7_9BACT|nr:DsrE family protein [Desulfovibrio subterraneus]WBF66422.1 DsrE family protein [Desulfovibrio subterraneus]GFM34540.1 hypothetical protein DSM101010T_29050 [Desulfovibrio subterraneus]